MAAARPPRYGHNALLLTCREAGLTGHFFDETSAVTTQIQAPVVICLLRSACEAIPCSLSAARRRVLHLRQRKALRPQDELVCAETQNCRMERSPAQKGGSRTVNHRDVPPSIHCHGRHKHVLANRIGEDGNNRCSPFLMKARAWRQQRCFPRDEREPRLSCAAKSVGGDRHRLFCVLLRGDDDITGHNACTLETEETDWRILRQSGKLTTISRLCRFPPSAVAPDFLLKILPFPE